ncbi:response regulator [Hydrogenophaga sp.]|uniref:response regulator n=1 Tax=Hydrogenophaga sp. TaxID=1904254 RepID=UPI002720EA42|nr:response regulator [Hydrogenophaga sp.]MDO8906401.1 response regulator [Hydrogenophaga sp.]
MKPEKILYVDDEAMALKYFERLVGPLAPVLTAGSVEEGRTMLKAHGSEIAVLVCDQRMPGERGNELLRHAREYYPAIVRMLTTAYSELGDAIEAINTGEIYRYINKPWELESLRADLKNALELAALRNERDELMRDKLMAQQSQLLANRLAALLMVGSAVHTERAAEAVHRYAEAVLTVGVTEPAVDWHRWEHADLLQAEAFRGVAVAGHLSQWLESFGAPVGGDTALQALATLAGGSLQGGAVHLPHASTLHALLTAPAGELPTRESCGWLAWLLWQGGNAQVNKETEGWRVTLVDAPVLQSDWMADAMERLGQS